MDSDHASDIVQLLKELVVEISLVRKQIEKLDRTIEKLNEPLDIKIKGE